MSPVSLLFSSDEESSRRLVQALRELELEIEPCPDIFTAVEWLTSRSFDVIVADWDCGPEAAFLLKNARELKLNKAAFTLALTSGKSNPTAEEDGPDLVLTKPLEPDQVKYAVLSNDRFLGCMKAWIARGDFAQAQGTTRAVAKVQNIARAENVERRPVSEQPSPEPLAARLPEPSPDHGHSRGETSGPLHLTFATFDRRLFRSLDEQNHVEHVSGKVKRYRRHRFFLGAFLTVAFLSLGYTFGQPLRVQSVFASVATAYKALEMRSAKLQSSEDETDSDSALAQAAASRRAGSGRYPSSRLRTVPLQTVIPQDEAPTSSEEVLDANARLNQDRLPSAASPMLIPDSLKLPPGAATVRTVSVRRSPSLLSQMEPVSLPEDLSQGLLLQKVAPSYPEKALKAGLQGAVVLQAWIDRDGSIRDLKLVDGSLLLGQAAVKAVKQWRYKPYVRNGVAVEAETYITVNFRLP
jgi:TonB family protein